MVYALDTNIISYLLRPSRNQELVRRFIAETQQNDYVIPPLSYYETLWYLLRKKAVAQLRIFNELYEDSLVKISMGEAEFIKAAEIKAGLEEKGTPIGKDADVFITAYCIYNGYTLVTNNMDDFERINALKNELDFVNWIEVTHLSYSNLGHYLGIKFTGKYKKSAKDMRSVHKKIAV